MGERALRPRRRPGQGRRIALLPATTYGRWAVWLAAANVLLVLSWSLLPGGAALGFACGVAGGVLALLAIRGQGERAVTVFLALLPLVGVIVFVLAELLVGHE